MEEKIEETKSMKPNRRRNILFALLGAGALTTLIAARPIAAAIQHGGGFHGPWGGRGGGHAMSPEAAKDKAGANGHAAEPVPAIPAPSPPKAVAREAKPATFAAIQNQEDAPPCST